MKCPFCSAEDTRVIDSRPTDDNASIRRRRQCPVCGKRFTTYEKIETLPLIVIKKDNNREPYDRSKIEAGIVPVSYTHLLCSNLFILRVLSNNCTLISNPSFFLRLPIFTFSFDHENSLKTRGCLLYTSAFLE